MKKLLFLLIAAAFLVACDQKNTELYSESAPPVALEEDDWSSNLENSKGLKDHELVLTLKDSKSDKNYNYFYAWGTTAKKKGVQQGGKLHIDGVAHTVHTSRWSRGVQAGVDGDHRVFTIRTLKNTEMAESASSAQDVISGDMTVYSATASDVSVYECEDKTVVVIETEDEKWWAFQAYALGDGYAQGGEYSSESYDSRTLLVSSADDFLIYFNCHFITLPDCTDNTNIQLLDVQSITENSITISGTFLAEPDPADFVGLVLYHEGSTISLKIESVEGKTFTGIPTIENQTASDTIIIREDEIQLGDNVYFQCSVPTFTPPPTGGLTSATDWIYIPYEKAIYKYGRTKIMQKRTVTRDGVDTVEMREVLNPDYDALFGPITIIEQSSLFADIIIQVHPLNETTRSYSFTISGCDGIEIRRHLDQGTITYHDVNGDEQTITEGVHAIGIATAFLQHCY